jgi:Tol biopolymer transport system component
MRRFVRAAMISAVFCTLLLLVAGPAGATYRGKNGRIEFSLDTGSGWQIETIRPNGKGLNRITSVGGSALSGDYSPDGTKIVFDIDPNGGDEGCGVFVMDAVDGSNMSDLTPTALTKPDACAWDPSFTPTGRRIVFLANMCASCPLHIRSMGLDGGNRRTIATDPCDCMLHAPDVSPDGKTILFVVERDVVVNGQQGNRKSLYTVRRNGTHMRKIVGFRFDVCNCGGDWAPNGSRIVSSDQAGPTAVPGKASNVFTIRPDGTGLRYVTHSRNVDIYLSVGTYSPDGRWIVYKRVTADGRNRLMQIHPSGDAATLIAKVPGDFRWRDWGSRPT